MGQRCWIIPVLRQSVMTTADSSRDIAQLCAITLNLLCTRGRGLIPAHQGARSTSGCFTPQRSSRQGEVVVSGHETRSWIRGAPGDIPCIGLDSAVRTGQEKVCLSQSRQDKAGEASQMSLNDEVIALNHLCTKMVRFFRRQQ